MDNTTIISKKWWTSKTLWVNIISILILTIQSGTGLQLPIPIAAQATIIAILNIILRTITNSNLTV